MQIKNKYYNKIIYERLVFSFVFCLFLGVGDSLNAQGYAFQHITVRDGLPTNFVYDITQDKQGYIWLSSEAGLIKSDGHGFELSGLQRQLRNEVVRLFGGTESGLWVQDIVGRIMLISSDSVEVFPFDVPKWNYRNSDLLIKEDESIWVAATNGIFVYNSRTEEMREIETDYVDYLKLGRRYFVQKQNGEVYLICQNGYYQFDDNKGKYYSYKDDVARNFIDQVIVWDDEILIDAKDKLYKLDTNEHVFRARFPEYNAYFNKGIVELLVTKSNDLLITSLDGLVQLHKTDHDKCELHLHLNDERLGGVLEDDEGNIWAITSQNGCYKATNPAIEIFDNKSDNKQVTFAKTNKKGQLVIGYDNNLIQIFDEKNLLFERQLSKFNHRLYDLIFDLNGDHLFLTSAGYYRFDEAFNLKNHSYFWSIKSGAFGPSGRLWLCTSYGFGYKVNPRVIVDIIKSRSYTVLPTGTNKCWVGTVDGLYFVEEDNVFKVNEKQLSFDIRALVYFKTHQLLVMTQKSGLILYDTQKDSILNQWNTSNGLSSDYCTDLLVDGDMIWLSTKQRLNKINTVDGSITILGVDQGLPSNEVRSISKSGSTLYASTNMGLATFDDSITIKRKAPRLTISDIKINERSAPSKANYDLEYWFDNIKIAFTSLTYKDAGESVYNYKMEGVDKDWIESSVGLAQYPSMSPGEYTFRIKTKTINSPWSAEKQIRFSIDHPFWKSIWFNLLVICFVTGILALIFFEAFRRRRISKDLKISRLTALRAQMNPHFLFNALNSIQGLIVDKDVRSANKYLAQFSKLVRNILNNSSEYRISLNKEVETLRFYLDLEALRLEDKFEYAIIIDPELEQNNLYLPPMLIQPYVENAIKHGLLHKKGDKKLCIRFFVNKQFLICEVEDNGVGRDKSKSIQADNYNAFPSKSTSISNDRVSLYNAISPNSLKVNIIDLENDLGDALGTKVILSIQTNFKGF